MSKNLTRKGLALTAVVALGASFFAGTPAFAADLGINNGSVSLAPNAGTNYAVLTDSTFVLKANSAAGVIGTGKYLKFKVSDADAKISAASIYGFATSAYATSNGTGSNGAAVGTNNLVTVTVSAGHKIKVGDKITVVANATPTAVAGIDASGVTVTAVSATTISYARTDALVTSLTATVAGTVALTPSYGTTRGTGTSFILDSKIDTNTANKTITLTSGDNLASHSVDVTAWVDDNDDGVIDATEYQSPTRTVKFLIPGDVVATTTIRPASAGDSTVTADVTTVPALNGDQIAAGKVAITFGRLLDTAAPSANATWSDVTQKWTATSPNFNSISWTDTYAGRPAAAAAGTGDDIASYSITKNVATITTAAAHNLRVGDYVIITSSGATRLNTTTTGGRKVTAVPSTTSFSYKVETAQESTTDVASTTLVAAGAITYGTILRDTVQAGTVTAQAWIYKAAATAGLVKNGTAAEFAVGAKVVSSIAITGVGSATVSADGTAIYKGTTSGSLSATLKDVNGDPVAAGVDVTIVATKTSAGTVTVNGTTVSSTGTTLYGKTDANGKVALAITNSSAVAAEQVAFTLTSQGASGTKTVVWADKVYSILDLNDQTAAGTARNRAVTEGAAYTFNFLVQDQFKAPAGDDIRLLVATTGNTVSTNTVALTAGKATVAVADGGLTTGAVTVDVRVQKLTAGVWALITDDSAIEWGRGGTGDLTTVAINYYTQTDAITLNAEAANYPSSTVASYAAAATEATLAGLDSRVANGDAPLVLAGDKAVVSGSVTNASTGALKSGAVVTVSAKGMLFKSGDVWSLDSATVLSNDGTFSVEVYGTAAGEKTVTVAVGAVTKTATVTFTGLGASKTNKLTAVAGLATVQAGRTVDYTATVTDKLGNPVEGFALKATISGAGYFAGSAAADGSVSVVTDKYGKAVVKALFASNDLGTATVVFADNDASTATADNLASVELKTEVGTTEADVTVGGRAIFASVEFAKGKTVTVTVDGKRLYSKLQTSDNYTELKFTQKKAGKHTVTVRISGGIVYTDSVVTTK